MDTQEQGIIEKTMAKYGLPEWAKPYLYNYAKSHPLAAIKHAKSFIEVRRKKGEVTHKHVKLPNGMVFDKSMVSHLVSLFFNGEENIINVSSAWTSGYQLDDNPYANYFKLETEAQSKRARALKNLAEGLNFTIEQDLPRLRPVYDYLLTISDWKQRLVATCIILRYSYSNSFGTVFYRVFYPASPELMRAIGKAFELTDNSRWGEAEAKRIVSSKQIPVDVLIDMSQQLLARVYRSIDAERSLAKKAGILGEVELLMDIAIAYPLHALKELGVALDVDEQIQKVKQIAAKL